jgi:CheY-like chemotaxis protein
MMSIELLKLGLGDDPRSNKILDTVDSSCRRGADLVRQIVSFARGLDDQRIAVRLGRLIDDLKVIMGETSAANIRIITTVPSDLWAVEGDPTQLHRMLLHLAVNARNAIPHGGTITLTAENLMIDAQYARTSREARAGPYVLLQMIDTGLAIPPEVHKRTFDPFFTTKELGKDTGIGLATVHAVVKSHGGFMNVESEIGRGTTFNIYLPANPALRGGETVTALVELPRGRDELVLVVDKESSIRDITQQTLEAFGYRAITAGDGAEAVALYAKQAQQIALVLIDMMLPIIDGAATIGVLMRINPLVKVVATSSIDSTDAIAKASNAGVRHFLLKPYAAKALVELVRQVIDLPAS